jgi:hypothetical protein
LLRTLLRHNLIHFMIQQCKKKLQCHCLCKYQFYRVFYTQCCITFRWHGPNPRLLPTEASSLPPDHNALCCTVTLLISFLQTSQNLTLFSKCHNVTFFQKKNNFLPKRYLYIHSTLTMVYMSMIHVGLIACTLM